VHGCLIRIERACVFPYPLFCFVFLPAFPSVLFARAKKLFSPNPCPMSFSFDVHVDLFSNRSQRTQYLFTLPCAFFYFFFFFFSPICVNFKRVLQFPRPPPSKVGRKESGIVHPHKHTRRQSLGTPPLLGESSTPYPTSFSQQSPTDPPRCPALLSAPSRQYIVAWSFPLMVSECKLSLSFPYLDSLFPSVGLLPAEVWLNPPTTGPVIVPFFLL